MAAQEIDTEMANTALTALVSANKEINACFNDLRGKTGNLENDWKSEAEHAAVSALYNIFAGNKTRSDILENYISVLSSLIIPGYTAALETNKKLADFYK